MKRGQNAKWQDLIHFIHLIRFDSNKFTALVHWPLQSQFLKAQAASQCVSMVLDQRYSGQVPGR